MKRLVLVLFSLLLVTSAHAQIYQWKNRSGQTILSDMPPTELIRDQPQVIKTEPASEPAVASKSLAERDLEFRKRQQESQEKAEKSRKEQAETAEAQEQCGNARRYLRSLESGERIGLQNEKGERYFLDDAQRRQEIEKTQRSVQKVCN